MNDDLSSAAGKSLAGWRDRSVIRQALVTLSLLALTLVGLSRFLAYIERRPGIVLPDPILALYPPVDVTWLTFAAIYLGIVIAIVALVRQPRLLIIAVQAYIVMIVVRMGMMYVVPFDPPETMIPLVDPLAELSAGGVLSRDLFFSGHTSTMFLLVLSARQPVIRGIFILCTALIAVLVLAQHVHYTVDVLVAPFVAYAAFRLVTLAHSRSDVDGGIPPSR